MFHIDLISIDWLLQKSMRWRKGHYSCPISFICRFSRSKQDFHWSIVSSKWKWFTRIWWNSLGSVDFLVDGHCCPISLHCPLKNSGQIEKSIRPLLMTIVHDHCPWPFHFSSTTLNPQISIVDRKNWPKFQIGKIVSSNCSTIKALTASVVPPESIQSDDLGWLHLGIVSGPSWYVDP